MSLLSVLVLLFLTSVPLFSAAEVLVLDEQFNTFDLSFWKHEITLGGGGNWEFEYYTNNRSNSYVKDGVLYILPTLTAATIGEQNLQSGYTMDVWGSSPADLCTGNAFYGCSRTAGGGGNVLNPVQSARVRSADSFTFKYGRMEVRAKLPKGDWLWPAIWLVPRHNTYGQWPASGEIDIVESRGNAAGYNPGGVAGGVDTFASTLHFGPYWAQDPYTLTTASKTLNDGTDFSTNWHTFGLFWNETMIYTYLDNDNNRVLEVPIKQSFWDLGGWGTKFNNPWQYASNMNAPFDQEFFIILNVASGGTNGYFPDGYGGKPWTNTDPNAVNSFWNAHNTWYSTWVGESAALRVDSIKVWQFDEYLDQEVKGGPVLFPNRK